MASGVKGRGEGSSRVPRLSGSQQLLGWRVHVCLSKPRLGAMQVPMWPLIENGQESMMVRC